jgi:glycosyltransferase involved in cell wall biosynthesis
MRTRYGAVGERVARQMSRGQLHDRAFAMPLVEDLIEHAHGLIGHSRLVVERAHALRPALPAAHVPMGVPLPPLPDRDAARAALGLPHHEPIWASFGHINPYKRIESTLRAFARFRTLHPNARYVLVGSVSPNYDVHALVRRLGLDAAVMITGHVPHAAFAQYVAATDLCLNLRAPTAGETSASLLRLLAAGRPTLVSALDTFNELPDDVCPKVDPDRSEGVLILAYAELFQQHPAIARQLGANARRYIATQHTLDGAADGYIRLLSQLYGWGDVPKQRAPLWDVEGGEQETRKHGDTGHDQRSMFQRRVPSGCVPASSAFSLASVAQAAAELGVRADDAPLQHVATTIGDLFGNGGSST